MEFRILGSLEVLGPAGVLPVPGTRLRALLAVLLLSPNEPVSAERLAEALFGEDAQASSVSTIRVHVSRLRRALGDDAGLLTTSQAGYRLRVRPDELDSDRFAQLVETGRLLVATDPARASRILRDALGLWRGRPLADLEFAAFVQPAIARLEEQRLAALELRIEADLDCDRAGEVLPELQGLVQQHPMRERLHGQLMLALYRCGRQADALEVYRRLRATFVEELGIEPSDELRDIESAILRHDPSLGSSRMRRPRRSLRVSARHPSRRLVALMALGTVTGVVTGMLALGNADSPNTQNATALGAPGAFRDQVVEVCTGVNASFAAQSREAAGLRSRLRSARTTIGQRDAILTATRASIDRGGHSVAKLRSLEPPARSRNLVADTARAWEDNLEHLREYALRLDRASSRKELLRAIAPITAARPAMQRNFVSVKAGLQRLGGRACRIDLYVAQPIPLRSLPNTKGELAPELGGGGGSGAPDVGGGGVGGGGEG